MWVVGKKFPLFLFPLPCRKENGAGEAGWRKEADEKRGWGCFMEREPDKLLLLLPSF